MNSCEYFKNHFNLYVARKKKEKKEIKKKRKKERMKKIGFNNIEGHLIF